jgi:hypothetical protein
MLKDPDEVLDYAVDWTDWLTGEGRHRRLRRWIVPTGLTQVSANLASGKATDPAVRRHRRLRLLGHLPDLDHHRRRDRRPHAAHHRAAAMR